MVLLLLSSPPPPLHTRATHRQTHTPCKNVNHAVTRATWKWNSILLILYGWIWASHIQYALIIDDSMCTVMSTTTCKRMKRSAYFFQSSKKTTAASTIVASRECVGLCVCLPFLVRKLYVYSHFGFLFTFLSRILRCFINFKFISFSTLYIRIIDCLAFVRFLRLMLNDERLCLPTDVYISTCAWCERQIRAHTLCANHWFYNANYQKKSLLEVHLSIADAREVFQIPIIFNRIVQNNITIRIAKLYLWIGTRPVLVTHGTAPHVHSIHRTQWIYNILFLFYSVPCSFYFFCCREIVLDLLLVWMVWNIFVIVVIVFVIASARSWKCVSIEEEKKLCILHAQV